MTETAQGVTGVEVFGFASWITSAAAFVIYILWAYTPDSVLARHAITYYPSKYWAIALPCWVCVTVVFVYWVYESGYGYPAFIALNPSKGKFATLRSAFNEASVKEFMDAVRNGRERVAAVTGDMAELETKAPWDGTDGEEAVEEEFSLEDLGIGGGADEKDEL